MARAGISSFCAEYLTINTLGRVCKSGGGFRGCVFQKGHKG